jgi:hypothetical protein
MIFKFNGFVSKKKANRGELAVFGLEEWRFLPRRYLASRDSGEAAVHP